MREFKKGQHVICKYHGNNGDLIVGRIDSVRHNGDVVLTNLLSGAHSLKKATVLRSRNLVVAKRVALTVVSSAKEKHAVRKVAVSMAARLLEAVPKPAVIALAKAYLELAAEDKAQFMRGIGVRV